MLVSIGIELKNVIFLIFDEKIFKVDMQIFILVVRTRLFDVKKHFAFKETYSRENSDPRVVLQRSMIFFYQLTMSRQCFF